MSRTRRWRRWAKRIAFAVVALVTLAFAFVFVVFHTDRGREWIRGMVEAELRTQFPGGAKLGAIEGSPFGTLTARDIQLSGVDGKPFASVAELHVDIALLPLVTKTARIERLTARDVTVHVPRELATAPRSGGPPPAARWDVSIEKLVVERGTLVIETEREPITIDDVSIGDGRLDSRHDAPITVSAGVRGSWRERGVPVEVSGSVRLDDEVVAIPLVTAVIGDVRAVVTNVVIDPESPERSTGNVRVDAPGAALAKLVPGVELPPELGDVSAVATATQDGGVSRVDVFGGIGGATARGAIWLDPAAWTARAVVRATEIDVGRLSRGRVTGRGEATAVLVAGHATECKQLAPGTPTLPDRRQPVLVCGTLFARAEIEDLATAHASVAVTATRDRATLVAAAAGAADTRGLATVSVGRDGDRWWLDRGYALAVTRDARVASRDRVPIEGALRAVVVIPDRGTATLAPMLSVDVVGSLRGDQLTVDQTTVARVRGTFEGRVDALGPTGKARLELARIRYDREPVGDAVIAVASRADGKLDGRLDGRLDAAPVGVRAAGVITLPVTADGATSIALAEHQISAPRGFVWRGRGGRVDITTEKVAVSAVRSASGAQSVDANGSFVRATRDLAVTVRARAIEANTFDPAYRGTVSGTLELSRTAMRWNGGGTVTASSLVVAPRVPPIDGDAKLTIAGRRVTLGADARTSQVGRVRIALDVDGPVDITDRAAWRRLERRAVRSAIVAITRVDLAGTTLPTSGNVDGELVLAGPDTRGTFTVRGVRTKIGAISGDVTFEPLDRSELGASSTVHIEGVGDANVAARIAFPVHPFDPVAWKQLGRGVVRVLTVSLDDVAIDPQRLAALGADVALRGRADVEVSVAAGAGIASATIDIRGLTGGPLRSPVDARIEATTDRDGTRAELAVRAGRRGAASGPWADDEKLFADLEANTPVTFDRWLVATRAVVNAPVRGSLVLPSREAKEVLELFGRSDVKSGTLGGEISIAGTLRVPTADGTLIARAIVVPPRIERRAVPTLDELRVRLAWGGAAGSLDIRGKESDGATLIVTASGRPDQLEHAIATADIHRFEIAPVAAFLPGGFVAATGKLSASGTMRGLSTIRGRAELDNGRVPLAPEVGTLRDAKAIVTIDDAGMRATLDGKLGGGKVALAATSGHDLLLIDVNGVLDDISPIGELEPKIDAKVTANVRRTGTQLLADVKIRNATVTVPPQTGHALLDPDMPSDIHLGPGEIRKPTTTAARVVKAPWIVANVDLGTTHLVAARVGINAWFNAPKLMVSVGKTFSIVGVVNIERGDVEVFGRRYQIDPGAEKLRFDGTTDALLALRLVYEFPDLTLNADVTRRISKPEVALSSQPGVYSQGQLLGFFLGGNPNGDPTQQTRDAATGAGASAVSSKLEKRVKKALPVKLDTLRCEPASSATGASCTAGRWLGEKLFLAYKHRIEARPGEYEHDLQLQYFLSRSILLEGSAGSGNHLGGDVLWRRRW